MTLKALVLLSGGQDSTTCLAQALSDFPGAGAVAGVAFDYGQRHKIELQQAEQIASLANIHLYKVDLPFISTLTHNALTRFDMDINTPTESLFNTFVDGRNLFFFKYSCSDCKTTSMPCVVYRCMRNRLFWIS